ncbi:MAG: T9SS type A sorting domain-containing protein [Bacteroidia bacterium]|nr:T9SS type A sorting domain-containing protein [Bacteroidia bacterium]
MKSIFKYILLLLSTSASFAQIDGQIDSTFGINGVAFSNFSMGASGTSIGIDNQQNIFAVGQISTSNQYDFAAVKFNNQGIIDTTFATNGKFTVGFGIDDFCNSIAIQTDDKIIMGGYSSNWDGFNINSFFTQFSLIRILNNGTVDSTFGFNGKFELDMNPIDCGAVAIALQSDGKIIAVGKYNNGSSLQVIAIRITTNGMLDTNFANNGIFRTQIDTLVKDDETTCCVIQPDNKIVIGCYTNDQPLQGKVFGLIRLTENGFIDLNFGISGFVKTDIPLFANDYPKSVKVQSDGKILLAGATQNSKVMVICRYNADGTLDNSFGNQGIDTLNISSGKDLIRDFLVLEDNKIILVGESNNNACILRLNQFGKIDSTFNGTGINTYGNSANEGFYNVHLMSSNKIVTAAYAKDSNQLFQLSVASYNSILFNGINTSESNLEYLAIYPNPSTQIIKFINLASNSIIMLTDLTGKMILQSKINSNQELDVGNLSSGIYFIKAQSLKGLQTVKFIKQ